MTRSILPGLLAASFCAARAVAGPGGAGAPAADRLLQKVVQGPSVPFSGHQTTEVFFATGPARALVQVSADGHGRMRRELTSGAAAGIVVLQIGPATWQRGTDGKWVRLPDRPVEENPAGTAAAILRNYLVTVGKRTKIAGRPATPVRIVPRRSCNPGRNLWVDPGTGIVLKDVMLAPDGRTRSTSEFVDIKLGPQPADRFQPPAHAENPPAFGPSSFSPRSSAAEVERESGRPILLPTYVPTGYRLVMYGIMRTGSGRLMPAIRYTDGLSAFTVFQRGWGNEMGPGRGFGGPGRGRGWRGGRGAPGRAPACVGQSDIQSAVVVVSGVKSNYLLVGDLSEAELTRVGKSLP